MQRRYLIAAVLMSLSIAGTSVADEVRYVEKDGITYRETSRTVRRPISETRYRERERTVYREEVETESRDLYRTVHVPVTEYRWKTRWLGRWNPFVQPVPVYHLEPTTTWEPRTEVVTVPITRRTFVPENRTEKVPVTVRRMVDEEVTSRVAIAGRSTSTASSDLSGSAVARRMTIGGSRLENDPPRYADHWRPIETTVRR
jgi:hypothetical protein